MCAQEVQKKVFEGFVPVSFFLEGENMPYAFKISRIVPIASFVFSKMGNFFGDNCKDLWFSVGDVPIQGYLPVGAIYDLFVPRENSVTFLNIQVHRTKFPEKGIQRCESAANAEAIFVENFKASVLLTDQSDLLLKHNENIAQNLLKYALEHNYDEYDKLLNTRCDDFSEMINVPIKLIKKDGTVQDCFAEYKDNLTIQDVIKDSSITKVLSQGIEIPLDIKVIDVLNGLLYPDSFVYLTCA